MFVYIEREIVDPLECVCVCVCVCVNIQQAHYDNVHVFVCLVSTTHLRMRDTSVDPLAQNGMENVPSGPH